METPEVKTKTVRRFDEKVGWIVEEVLLDAILTSGSAEVNMSADPAIPVKITADIVPLSVAQAALKAAGFVAIPQSVIDTLSKTAQAAIEKAGINSPAAVDDAALVEQIEAATTMDELTNLLDGVTSVVVIAAAEEKAAELTA